MGNDSRDEMVEGIILAIRRQIAAAILFNHQVAERLGLSVSETQFLNLLGIYGPLTPGRLADLSGLSTSTVTGVVDRLEEAGFARRERDASDRRKVVVSLIPERFDREVVALYESQDRLVREVVEHFGQEELEAITRFLKLLVAGREQPHGGAERRDS